MSAPRPGKLAADLIGLNLSLSSARAAGKRIGLCHGCFDLLHIGHISHFEEAASLVDVLVVSVSWDNACRKGPDRPTFDYASRARAVAALEVVDYVCCSTAPTAVDVIRAVSPTVFFKGPDYATAGTLHPGFTQECDAVRESGGSIHTTSPNVVASSTSLLNKLAKSIVGDRS